MLPEDQIGYDDVLRGFFLSKSNDTTVNDYPILVELGSRRIVEVID